MVNIAILMPNSPYELRISVSREQMLEKGGKEPSKMFVRHRDRKSYRHKRYSYDLTCVSSGEGKKNPESLIFEVELETSSGKEFEIDEFIDLVMNLPAKFK